VKQISSVGYILDAIGVFQFFDFVLEELDVVLGLSLHALNYLRIIFTEVQAQLAFIAAFNQILDAVKCLQRLIIFAAIVQHPSIAVGRFDLVFIL